MAIDSSIYSQIQQPRPVNMLADYANLMQVQGAQQANQLNRLKMDEYTRGVEKSNALNRIYQGAMNPDGTIDRTRLFSGAASSGLGAEIPGLQKTFAESDKAALDADEKRFTLAKNRYDVFQQTLGSLAQEPNLSKDLVLQAGQGLVAQGILPKAIFDQAISGLPDDPAQLRAKVLQSAKFRMTPQEIFRVFSPTPEKVDNGGQISFRDTNPNSPTYGQNVAGAAVQKVQSPDNRASVSASMANAAATREVAAATRDAARIKANQDVEMKLGDDYRTQSKGFKEVSDAYRTINATLDKATTSPAATLAGATKFMKLLDPGSVVRESELGMALAASGVFDRAANYVNTLRSGKVLTAKQVADFKNITGQIYQAAQEGQKQLDAHYRQQAKTYGLRPEMIVQDLGQNTSAPVDLGSLPAGGGKVINFGDLK